MLFQVCTGVCLGLSQSSQSRLENRGHCLLKNAGVCAGDRDCAENCSSDGTVVSFEVEVRISSLAIAASQWACTGWGGWDGQGVARLFCW